MKTYKLGEEPKEIPANQPTHRDAGAGLFIVFDNEEEQVEYFKEKYPDDKHFEDLANTLEE